MRYERRRRVVDAVQFRLGVTPLPAGVVPLVYDAHGRVRGPHRADEEVPADSRVGVGVWTHDGWKVIYDQTWIVTHEFGTQAVWSPQAFAREFAPSAETDPERMRRMLLNIEQHLRSLLTDAQREAMNIGAGTDLDMAVFRVLSRLEDLEPSGPLAAALTDDALREAWKAYDETMRPHAAGQTGVFPAQEWVECRRAAAADAMRAVLVAARQESR